MNDLISKSTLLKTLEMRNMTELYPEWRTLSLGMREKILRLAGTFRRAIDSAPVVDAVPVVHARWIHDINNLYGCSECMARETMSHKKLKKFCPNCGARMDGEENER